MVGSSSFFSFYTGPSGNLQSFVDRIDRVSPQGSKENTVSYFSMPLRPLSSLWLAGTIQNPRELTQTPFLHTSAFGKGAVEVMPVSFPAAQTKPRRITMAARREGEGVFFCLFFKHSIAMCTCSNISAAGAFGLIRHQETTTWPHWLSLLLRQATGAHSPPIHKSHWITYM